MEEWNGGVFKLIWGRTRASLVGQTGARASWGKYQPYFGYDGSFLNKGKYLFYRIDNPKFDIDKKELLEAVEFEFGIKYFDSVFDELKQKALQIFSVKYDQYFYH